LQFILGNNSPPFFTVSLSATERVSEHHLFDGSRPNTWRWQPFVMKQISYQKVAPFSVIGILIAN
jgi:hypothetical protein